jgi:hypothetical protein
MRLFSLLLVVLAYVMTTGCSAHRLSINDGSSRSAIYELDERTAFNLAYSAIQEVFPQESISVITLPTRGYITKFLAPPLHVDWFTQEILIHRASGTTNQGQKVSGYWVEVSGSGSSFLQGQIKNSEIFEKIINYFESNGVKHVVTDIRSEKYLVQQEEFNVKGADYLEGKGNRVIITNQNQSSENDTADNIRKLHQLMKDGIITKEEFEAKKQDMLKISK